MTLAEVSLDDKYAKERGRIFLTGIQALVRLPMLQRRRDLAAGHDTAGYVTGYRGSPLGGLDQQLAAARRFLDEHHVVVRPEVNEDLAATALWGTQQAELHGEGKLRRRVRHVVRQGAGGRPHRRRVQARQPRRHLAALGGVLVLMGDDHTCESSTTAHQSEFALIDAQIPVLNPAGVAEILEFGLKGFALSRYSGCWVGLKCVHDTVNTAASIELDPDAVRIVAPEFELPPGGLNIRWPDPPLAQEERLHRFKLDAARAFARSNRFDRLVFDPPAARLGIVSTGKS